MPLKLKEWGILMGIKKADDDHFDKACDRLSSLGTFC